MKNQWVSLEPLRLYHAAELARASTAEVWRFMPTKVESTESGMAEWIRQRTSSTAGDNWPWLVRDAKGVAAGSTSLFDVNSKHRRGELGWTWYGPKWHGTSLNPAAKLLALSYAFESLKLRRVQLKCDSRNEHSAAAIRKLGANHDGTLRSHDEMWDGHIRDAEVFSILDTEWPSVRRGLEARLSGFETTA